MKKLAYCGNDCAVCPRYTATQSSDVFKLNEVANLWNQLGWRETIEPSEKMLCYGCSASSFCRYGIQQCATENAVDNCGKCQNYPCNLTFKSFEQTEIYAESVRRKCSDEEYQCLKIAFFSKNENLDIAHSQSQNVARLVEDE